MLSYFLDMIESGILFGITFALLFEFPRFRGKN